MDFNLDLDKCVGQGYEEFLYTKKRYVVCKGSRGSKKSCTQALKIIYMMMKYSRLKPNTLVIRKFFNTHRNSTRAQLSWAIDKLGVRSLWKVPLGENTLTYIPTGQQILFRGLDDPQSITSITSNVGHLCWVWFEEAYQINSEDDFNKIDLSIRGDMPSPLYKQITLTFNPWSDKHWLKRRFFDDTDENTLAMTTNYMINEFLGDDDKKLYDIMKSKYPRRYAIEGLGEWGVAEGLVYSNWTIEDFDIGTLIQKMGREKNDRGLPALVHCCGMDFGYNDPTAFVAMYADTKNYKIYIYYEFFEVQMENRKIAARLITDGFGECQILADSEDPRTINELRLLGLHGIKGARKGAGSVLGGIQKLQDYEIIVHADCPHTQEALGNYSWKKDKISDVFLNVPEHDYSHICVTGDTLVNTVHGKVAIKDLVGKIDRVFCYDVENNKVDIQTCFDASVTGYSDVYELELEDGQRITLTPNHKVLTEKGYIRCDELTENDCVISLAVDDLWGVKIKGVVCTIRRVSRFLLQTISGFVWRKNRDIIKDM